MTFLKRMKSYFLTSPKDFAKTGCCRHCKGKSLYADPYPRKPRGFPPVLPQEVISKYFSFRFSFLCNDCNRRTTPRSVRFLGRKIYIAPSILWVTYTAEQGHLPDLAILRNILEPFFGAKTSGRWLDWWREAVWKSPFWKEFQGQILSTIKRDQFIIGIWTHFIKCRLGIESEIEVVLDFFSPITLPEVYPF